MAVTLTCPVCHAPLALSEDQKSYRCPKKHCYDRAKSGYVNLIPIGKKRSKIPGDNKDMIRARVDFLSAGYYQPLSDAINANAIKLLKDVKHPVVLDAGCGEGYYTHRLYDALTENGKKVKLFGTDISKFGLEAAGKHHAANGITYAAASSFEIPLPDHCVDLLVCIFSPYAEKEFLRVLKPGGKMLLAIPGAHHLWELKSTVYETPYKNEVKDYPLAGFEFLSTDKVDSHILLPDQKSIQNLFSMTPYSCNTPPQAAAKLLALEQLTTRIQFEVLSYRAL